jgi:hypothetical protein
MNTTYKFLFMSLLSCALFTEVVLAQAPEITTELVSKVAVEAETPKISDELLQKYAELFKKADQEVWTTEEFVKECAKLAEQETVVVNPASDVSALAREIVDTQVLVVITLVVVAFVGLGVVAGLDNLARVRRRIDDVDFEMVRQGRQIAHLQLRIDRFPLIDLM